MKILCFLSHCNNKTGIPKLFEPSDTSGILTYCCGHNCKMAATESGVSHKMVATIYLQPHRKDPCGMVAAYAKPYVQNTAQPIKTLLGTVLPGPIDFLETLVRNCVSECHGIHKYVLESTVLRYTVK